MAFTVRALIVVTFLVAMAVIAWVMRDQDAITQVGVLALIAAGFFWAIWLEGGRGKNHSDH